MSKSYIIGIILLFATTNLAAQGLFRDSGQAFNSFFSASVKLGDLDGDGDLDAAIAKPSHVRRQTNEIWLNDGTGYFTQQEQPLGSSYNLCFFDIDQDGDLDLFEYSSWANDGTRIRCWLNDGGANFTESDRWNFEGTAIVFAKVLGGDNTYEAITMKSTGFYAGHSTLRIYSIDASTCTLENELVYRDFPGNGFTPGDLNSDGYADLVMYRVASDYILLNDREGGFVKSDQELPGVNHTLSVVLEDVNGDGFLDILQSNYHGDNGFGENLLYRSNLYLNDGSGRFTETLLPYNSQYLTTSVAVADMDNDGDQDIYINHGNQISTNVQRSELLINDGNANFTSTSVSRYINSYAVAFGDLDDDGDLDLFLACAFIDGPAGNNRIWFNTTVDK